MMIEWKLKSFKQLTNIELYQLLKLRVDVFVVEQTCPYPELDNKDHLPQTLHLAGYKQGELVACARLLAPGVSYTGCSIGRIATAQQARGGGLGHQLVAKSIEECVKIWPDHAIEIGAQDHLSHFYGQHGFTATSDMYLEDGIPHIDMKRER